MRFKIDENMPLEAADLLRTAGHDASSVHEQALGGRPDGAIASTCRLEARVLITLDADFSDIRTYPPADYPGLIVLRLPKQSAPGMNADARARHQACPATEITELTESKSLQTFKLTVFLRVPPMADFQAQCLCGGPF